MKHNSTFHSRLSEQPSDIYVEELRKPEFEILREEFFVPLTLLNRAHIIMLERCELVDTSTAADVLRVFSEIESDGVDSHVTGDDYSDIHFYIEDRLMNELGSGTGGVLQTGRSRTDVYDAVLRIIVRERLLDIMEAVNTLRATVQEQAAENTDVITTAYTHSQPAQPITFAHYLLSFDHLLSRDFERLGSAYERTNENPLGAAVTGGTGFDIDRSQLSTLCGFQSLCYNTYDATASMDFIPEATSDVALLMTNLSRLAHDLIEWSTVEFDYLEISDAFASVSSMLPQKKNPYPLEKLRTEASNTIGGATSSLTHLKGSPYGDVSEVAKYAVVPLLRQSEDVCRMLRLMAGIVDTITVNEDEMRNNVEQNFSTMTEVADTLVREEGLSFREAHEVVGTMVKNVLADQRDASQIKISDLQEAADHQLGSQVALSSEELQAALDPEVNVRRRDIVGGTAPSRNKEDLEQQKADLETKTGLLDEKAAQLEVAAELRTEESNKIISEIEGE